MRAVPGGDARAACGRFAIRVEHVEVRRDRIVAHVSVAEERFSRATPALIARLLPDFPHLLEHSCVNDCGATFSAVAGHTSTPHLLEHLAIEAQARAEAENPEASPATYLGKTFWENRAALRARVELSYANDLSALASLRDAARALNAALLAEEAGDGSGVPYGQRCGNEDRFSPIMERTD